MSFQHISGKITKNGLEAGEAKGSPVTRFSVTVAQGFGDDAPEPRFVRCTVFNEDIQKQVKEQLGPGSVVTVVGEITVGTYNDKTQYNMKASRVGVTEFYTRSGSQQRADAPPAKPAAEELDW